MLCICNYIIHCDITKFIFFQGKKSANKYERMHRRGKRKYLGFRFDIIKNGEKHCGVELLESKNVILCGSVVKAAFKVCTQMFKGVSATTLFTVKNKPRCEF